MKNICLFAILIQLAACTGNSPNHIGNPASLPIQGLSTGIENRIYNARRKKVSNHVTANHQAIITDIKAQGGPALTLAYDLAGVPQSERRAVSQLLLTDRHIYFVPDTEPLVVAFMVHGK